MRRSEEILLKGIRIYEKSLCHREMVQAFSLSHSMSIFDYGIKDFVYILVFLLRLFNDKVIALLRGYVLWVEGVDSEK